MFVPKKILVVFGAIGNQGGSVIRSILEDSKTAAEFKIRAITRDLSKPRAKALEAQGVECVAADINNKEQIRSALQGAYAVFAVTNFWDKMEGNLEIAQGKTIADVAKVRTLWYEVFNSYSDIGTKECGVQHLIWSSLYNVNELTNGEFPIVEHFDTKATVEKYIRRIGIPATFFMQGFSMSNIPGMSLRQLPPNNDWTMALPMPSDTPIPCFDPADDTGKLVKAILTHRDQFLGKRVLGATAYYTPDQIMAIFKEVKPKAGKNAKIVEASKDAYKEILAKDGL